MNILVQLDDRFSTDWVHMVGKMNMASKLFEYKYQKEYASLASNIYCKRQELINEIEAKYIAPIIKLRNKYDWFCNTSHHFLLLSIDDSFVKYEIEYLKQNKVSFVSEVEHSEDDFGKSEEMMKLIKLYNETQPKQIGFV